MNNLEMGINGRLILKDGSDILPWCPCGEGCHICSGTGYGLERTVQQYYNDWRHSHGNYNMTFTHFMEFGRVYDTSRLDLVRLEKEYENK